MCIFFDKKKLRIKNTEFVGDELFISLTESDIFRLETPKSFFVETAFAFL